MMDPNNKLTEAAALNDTALENAVGGAGLVDPVTPNNPAELEDENPLFF